jgi:hypothetical protein
MAWAKDVAHEGLASFGTVSASGGGGVKREAELRGTEGRGVCDTERTAEPLVLCTTLTAPLRPSATPRSRMRRR